MCPREVLVEVVRSLLVEPVLNRIAEFGQSGYDSQEDEGRDQCDFEGSDTVAIWVLRHLYSPLGMFVD